MTAIGCPTFVLGANSAAVTLSTGTAYANGAYQMAVAYLSALQAAITALTTDITIPVIDEQQFSPDYNQLLTLKPAPPTGLTPVTPDFPEDRVSKAINPLPPINMPPFTIGDLSINIPSLPDPVFPVFSGTAPALSDITVPSVPTTVMPDDPVQYLPTIPEFTGVSFPTFAATFTEEDFVEPVILINEGDGNYSTQLLSLVQDKLEHDVEFGGTGLDPLVENDIFNRGYERDLLAHNDSLDRIAAEWSKRGFALPDGLLATMILTEEINFTNKRLDTGREISIKQAELAQTNTHFAIEKSITLEGQLITWNNQVVQRTFEASKVSSELGLELAKVNTQRYIAKIEIYKARAAVYETLIRAEIGKLEAYKAQLEGARLTTEINRNNVEVYKARLGALELLINIYRTEMEASKVQAEIDQLKMTAFKIQVEAYKTEVDAKTAEYNLKQIQLEGEKTRIQAYAAAVDAYGKRVEATKTEAAMRIDELRATVEQNKNVIAEYMARIDGYKAKLSGEVERIKILVQSYEGEVKAYEADARAYGVLADLDIKTFEARIQQAINEANILLKSAEINMKNYEEINRMRLSGMESGSQVAAQLAAAALNAHSSSAHLSQSASLTESKSQSCGETHYFDETTI